VKIIHTPRFDREYKKLAIEIKLAAEKQEKIFRKNPRDHRLKTHKLKGNLAEYWSFSVTYSYRIIFRWANERTAVFVSVGDHRVYQ